MSAAIVERIPHAVVMRNQIPKSYLPYDLYCNLIPNSDPNCSTFMQVPRIWAFEVSYKGNVSFVEIFWKTSGNLHSLFIIIVDLLETARKVLAQRGVGRQQVRRDP